MILTVPFPFERKPNLPKTSDQAKNFLVHHWQNEIFTVGTFLMIFNAWRKKELAEKEKLAKNIINQKQVKRFDEDQDQITFSGDDLSVIWPTYLL